MRRWRKDKRSKKKKGNKCKIVNRKENQRDINIGEEKKGIMWNFPFAIDLSSFLKTKISIGFALENSG